MGHIKNLVSFAGKVNSLNISAQFAKRDHFLHWSLLLIPLMKSQMTVIWRDTVK